MRKNRGFTLLELVIVLGIIGILASLALPAYNGYQATARRTAAQQFMVDIANAEETYRADLLTYVAIATAAELDSKLHLVPAGTTANYYTFTVTGATARAYLITATPKNGQPGGNLTLDQAGAKTGW